MVNVAALQRKLVRLEDQARILYPEKAYQEIFHLNWHSPEYRTMLEPLKQTIEAKANARKHINITDYTQHERERALLWLHLEDALKRGDDRDTQAYRHWLSLTPEQTILQFLSMPETAIPEQARRRVGYAVFNAREQFREDQQRFRRWYENDKNLAVALFAREWLAAFIPEHAAGRSSQTPVWTIEERA